MVVGESKRTANIMDGIENTGDVRMHDHRLRLKQRWANPFIDSSRNVLLVCTPTCITVLHYCHALL